MTGGTVNELGLHGANAMVEQINDGIRQQSILEQDAVAETQMNTQFEHMANVAAQNAALFEKTTDMIAQMKEIQREVLPRKRPTDKGKREQKQKQYCWTHGSCAHSSKECRMKKEGHKDAATFNNMMGAQTKIVTGYDVVGL